MSLHETNLAGGKIVKAAISFQVEKEWREETAQKSSLQFVNPNAIAIGKGHPVWSNARILGSRNKTSYLQSSLFDRHNVKWFKNETDVWPQIHMLMWTSL